jgi:acyl-CoA thioesterase
LGDKITSDTLKAFFRKDLFAEFVGIELLDAKDGRSTARMRLKAHHRNGIGLIQGGAIFTLADLAFAAAVHSRGQIAVAIHCSISYLKAAQGDVLLAEAMEVSCGPKIAVYTVRITDASGEVVSLFQGMAYRKKESWNP